MHSSVVTRHLITCPCPSTEKTETLPTACTCARGKREGGREGGRERVRGGSWREGLRDHASIRRAPKSSPEGRACDASHLAHEVPLDHALEGGPCLLGERAHHALVHLARSSHIRLSQKRQQSVVNSTPRIATHPFCGWACVADVSMCVGLHWRQMRARRAIAEGHDAKPLALARSVTLGDTGMNLKLCAQGARAHHTRAQHTRTQHTHHTTQSRTSAAHRRMAYDTCMHRLLGNRTLESARARIVARAEGAGHGAERAFAAGRVPAS